MSENIKKRKRVSKKTKKSWRLHIDTKDVDKYLEEERLEERLGAPFIKRPDSQLFEIDSAPNEELLKAPNSKAAYRQALRNAEPKCYASLKPHTAVPDPISKRNRVKTPEERRHPIAKRLEQRRKASGELTLTERIAEKNRQLSVARRNDRPKRGGFTVDIWENEPSRKVLKEIDSEWLTSDTMRHTLANKGIRKKKIPVAVHKKTSALPTIEAPHPGTSYNPSYEDHQNLLREIADKELKLIKEEEHLDRVTTKMFKKVLQVQKDSNWLEEASEGLPLPSNPEIKEEPDNEDDNEIKRINPPAKNVKKTKVQRRKQKEQKKLKLELKRAKVEKKKIGDIYKLRSLKKQIETTESKVMRLREKREIVKEKKAAAPKTLSRTKFEPPEGEFQLGEELSGNLRGTAPVGNLLKDRYKSLQQRSILAPGKLVLKRNKPKVKKFIKPDHKITLPQKNVKK